MMKFSTDIRMARTIADDNLPKALDVLKANGYPSARLIEKPAGDNDGWLSLSMKP